MIKVGVTGSRGFIGRHLLNYLGTRAVPLLRGVPEFACDGRVLQYENPASLVEAARGLDAIVLLGGLAHRPRHVSDSDIMRVNTYYPYAVAMAAAQVGVETIVYLSSTKVFARPLPGEIITDNALVGPDDIYGRSKLQAELNLASVAGIRVVSYRPPLVYGTGVKGNLALLAKALRLGLPLPLGAVDDNRRTLLSVHNLCEAILTAVDGAVPSGTYVVCDGSSLSTKAIIEFMSSKRAALFPVSKSTLRSMFKTLGQERLVETLLDSFECRADRLQEVSPWRPRVRPETGLAEAMLCSDQAPDL